MESILPENRPIVRRKRRVKHVRKMPKRSRMRWYEAVGLVALGLAIFAGIVLWNFDIAYRAELRQAITGERRSAPMEAVGRIVDPDKLRRTR